MPHYNSLIIDLTFIRHNLNALQEHLPSPCRLMPMLKASAYGTEAKTLGLSFQRWGIEIVGVSQMIEAIELRREGYKGAIFCIHAAPFEAHDVVKYEIEVAVSNSMLLENLNKEALGAGKKVKVHLDINTGMQRFGVRPEHAVEHGFLIANSPGLILEGIMTHFIASETSQSDDLSQKQIAVFRKVVDELQEHGISAKWIHAANSAAALRFNLSFCNMVRVGLATFGIYSSNDERNRVHLQPALTLKSCIVAINECYKGETVGYLQGYEVKKERERIAILPIGYHDGLHLHHSGRGHVLIHGKKAPFVGRICMDFMMVDVTEIEEAHVGSSVILFGADEKGNVLAIEDLVQGKTNVRELLTSLGARIRRDFVRPPIMISKERKGLEKHIA